MYVCGDYNNKINCAVEIDGVIVEDGAWMRKKDDNAHINLSELDLKDVNIITIKLIVL